MGLKIRKISELSFINISNSVGGIAIDRSRLALNDTMTTMSDSLDSQASTVSSMHSYPSQRII